MLADQPHKVFRRLCRRQKFIRPLLDRALDVEDALRAHEKHAHPLTKRFVRERLDVFEAALREQVTRA